MSRGAGRVEREIAAAFAADPDNAFTADELCQRIYPGFDIRDHWDDSKKYRVAVIRAAKSLARRWPDLGWGRSWMRGRINIYFNAASVSSWAMARMKGDQFEAPYHTEEEMRASLRPGGYHHRHIVEGGAWRRHRDIWIAERDGDTAALERLNAEQKRNMDERVPAVQAAISHHKASVAT